MEAIQVRLLQEITNRRGVASAFGLLLILASAAPASADNMPCRVKSVEKDQVVLECREAGQIRVRDRVTVTAPGSSHDWAFPGDICGPRYR